MLKKMTALLLLSAFTHVYAFSPLVQSSELDSKLSKAFDSVNFKLNVEWDQKDVAFFDQTISEFEKEISTLQEEGLGKTDLLKSALVKIKDEQVKKDIQELSTLMNESQMSKTESREFIIKTLSSTYSKGASWSGHRHGRHTAILIAAIIIILCVCNDHSKPAPRPRDPGCDPTHGQMYDFNNGCVVM